VNGKLVASLILPLLITCIAVSPAFMIPAPPPITHQTTIQLTSGSSSSIDPAFSPSGTTITYASNAPHGYFQIWIMASNGNHPLRLTSLSGNATGPQWSPNGEEIAFLETEQGKSNIWIVSPQGKNPSQLTHTQEIMNFQWSPDSSKIVYEEAASGLSSISIVNVLNGESSVLISGKSQEYRTPVWNTNGSSIAFSSNSTGSYHIWMVNDNGNGLKQLTSGNGSDLSPKFSPIGSALLYISNKSDFWDVWTLNLESGGNTDVTAVSSQAMGSKLFIDGMNPEVYAIWNPNASRVLFSEGSSGNNSLYVAQASNAKMSLFGRVAIGSSQFFISGLVVGRSVLRSSYDWNPDGSQVAYSVKVSGTYQILLTSSRIVQPRSSYG
jgi:Tol biopolymer transport system component